VTPQTTISAVVHGESGVGKTWCAGTLPGPRVYLDIESRARFAPLGARVQWDPHNALPTGLTEDSTVIVSVRNFDVMNLVHQWLAAGNHPFKSFVMDSLTELQKRAIDSIAGANAMETQNWGELLRKMEVLVRAFRDLADPAPNRQAMNVLYIAGTEEKQGKLRPMLQGALGKTLPYHVDICGYLAPCTTPDDPTTLQRALYIQPTPLVVAKDGTDILTKHYGPAIVNPNFTEMLTVLDNALGVAS
jgi:hypothetical protein